MLVSYQDSIFGIDWFANASEMALTLFTKLNYSQCQHSAKDFQEMAISGPVHSARNIKFPISSATV